MARKTTKKLAEHARRQQELEQYGRLLSLRPSIAHKNKKKYTRKDKSWKKEDAELV